MCSRGSEEGLAFVDGDSDIDGDNDDTGGIIAGVLMYCIHFLYTYWDVSDNVLERWFVAQHILVYGLQAKGFDILRKEYVR